MPASSVNASFIDTNIWLYAFIEAHLPYGEEGVLVQAIDVAQATGLLAKRYAPERYQESTTV